MTLEEFVEAFAGELEETPADQVAANTEYKTLEEWGSLTALSIISMVDAEMDKVITGADLRGCKTIEELYNLIETKE